MNNTTTFARTNRRDDCFLTDCGEPATTWLAHPDRGPVRTCRYHARKIPERLNLPGDTREEVVA